MEFITSRGFQLPATRKEMEQHEWFNVWQRREFPYQELLVGDTVNWFDRPNQRLSWKTRVQKVFRRKFNSKKEILVDFPDCASSEYFQKATEAGYFLLYKVEVIEKLDVAKPKDFSFPRLGWIRLDRESAKLWANLTSEEDNVALDAMLPRFRGSAVELLEALNEKMQDVSPERVKKAINIMLRKDGRLVRGLKEAKGFKCEFPGCGIQIPKKNGGFYVEVAHIEPIAHGGKSTLGNLLVLCPNHHKEFDYGDLKLSTQTRNKLAGRLNGKNFSVDL